MNDSNQPDRRIRERIPTTDDLHHAVHCSTRTAHRSRLTSHGSPLPSYRSRRCLILGLAREGVSLARFLAERGARVTVTDSAPSNTLQDQLRRLRDVPVDLVLGSHHPELVQNVDSLFVSPGVPESNRVYRAAVAANLPIESMTTLFFALCPGTIVGVTGSSGKTTTTGLIGHILQTGSRDVVVGGNIGAPMLDLLPQISAGTTVVLELSSFQLSILSRSPHISVVTNISPNHLDRHGTMESYIEAKRHIVDHQTAQDWVVLNAGDPYEGEFVKATPATVRWFGDRIEGSGATVDNGQAGVVTDSAFRRVIPIQDIPLPGPHNVENVLAAIAATQILEVRPADMAEAIRAYKSPAHRLQTVGENAGVRFVDDSVATSPARASVALKAIEDPIVLIAGGRDKNLPWDEFSQLIVARVHALFLIGEAASKIEQAVRRRMHGDGDALASHRVYHCRTLCDAVQEAAAVARSGDVVLLSPGCTSYDMFTDFEERGDAFARAVEELIAV